MLIPISQESLCSLLKPRAKDVHKGMFGHLLIIGGNEGMAGSVQLAAQAALYTGVGAVSIFTNKNHPSLNSLYPELMIHNNIQDLDYLIKKASVCIIGPGLGLNAWAIELFNKITKINLPTIIDASALHLLTKTKLKNKNWILTPHPGEAAALLKITVDDIQKDRLSAATKMQKLYDATIVLKGSGTLVVNANTKHICTLGNPGMASAGMGDVLSGVLGSLVAQGLSLLDASLLGVWLHAKAGDDLAKNVGIRGLLAHELIPYLRKNLNFL